MSFQHDSAGVLVDVPSPTELDLPEAMLNYAGSFLLVFGLLVLLFQVVLRRRRPAERIDVLGSMPPEHQPPSDGSNGEPPDPVVAHEDDAGVGPINH